MHILEIPSFFPPYGGEFCLEQAKALKALGHEVRIMSNVQLSVKRSVRDFVTYPYGRWTEQMEGVEVMRSWQRGIPKVIRPNVKRWVHIVESMFADYVSRYGKPDVLHAHCAKWAGYAAMKISRQYRIPYVITEHLSVMALEQEFGPAPSHTWQIPLLRQAYQQAGMVIPVSEELVDAMSCYYGKDYRWKFISNVIDTQFFAFHEREHRDGRPFRYCCVANFDYRKGYDVLFPAFQFLKRQKQDVALTIIGRDTDGQACRRMIAQCGLSESVEVLGCQQASAVREALYSSDALVLASRSEVQPLVLLEAMSTGIPVVATECIPRNQRLDEGCFIVPIGNVEALADMMLEVSMKQIDGKRLSEQVSKMASPESVGRQLEALFRQVVSASAVDATRS